MTQRTDSMSPRCYVIHEPDLSHVFMLFCFNSILLLKLNSRKKFIHSFFIASHLISVSLLRNRWDYHGHELILLVFKQSTDEDWLDEKASCQFPIPFADSQKKFLWDFLCTMTEIHFIFGSVGRFLLAGAIKVCSGL